MKYVFYVFVVLVVGAVGSGLYWYTTENDKAARAEQYRRDQIRLEKEEAQREKDRAEDERIRKERMVEVAKDDAVKLFLRYLDREETRLKTEVEEAKIQLQKIGIDQESLADELKAIERANAARVASSKRRGEKQRDKVERVSAILKSPVINRLAATYCGEDLSALRSEFEAEIQKTKDVDDVYHKKRVANRKKYDDEMKDINGDFDRKLGVAKEKLSSAISKTKADAATLEKRLADINASLDKLEEKEKVSQTRHGRNLTPWEKRDLKDLRSARATIEAQLSAARNQLQYGDADMAQNEVIVSEKQARTRADSAGIRLRDADIAVQEERDHEQDVHNLALLFEARSLDQVRAAMKNRRVIDGKRLADAEAKIRFLREASANMDFLNAAEVEAMRKKVANRLSVNIANEVLK